MASAEEAGEAASAEEASLTEEDKELNAELEAELEAERQAEREAEREERVRQRRAAREEREDVASRVLQVVA